MDSTPQGFSLSRACHTCRYWEPLVKTSVEDGGECRYGPPTPGQDDVGVWPATHRDAWCRCWKSEAETPKRKAGRPVEHKPDDLLPLLTGILYQYEGMGRVELYKEVYALRELSFSTFCKVLDALTESGQLVRHGVIWWVKGQREALEAEEA